VTVTMSREDDSGVVRVRDTGSGIVLEFLPFVFEMFRQQEEGTSRRHAGMGIGLALVKKLVEAHRGTVAIASQGTGQGTEVTIRLPLVAETVEDVPVSAGTGAPHRLEGLRILVVEDMDDSREATRLMLEWLGATVVTARDGVEGLAAVMAGHVDVVVCDLQMPRKDGFEFLHALRNIEGETHLPVIAISGLASSADHLRIKAAGFASYVDKPFDAARLLAGIDGALARRDSGSSSAEDDGGDGLGERTT
jgi:CheY-like chemotaxis protein